MDELTKTFSDAGDFAACYAAEKYLAERGFSVGIMQRGDPRGILFGDYDIMKWRNLGPLDREALHGEMQGSMRNGPVTIRIYASDPEVRAAFLREAP